MELRFTNHRQFSSVDELEGLDRKQGHGLFVDHEDFPDYYVEVFDVVDGQDAHLHTAWFGGLGSMLVFRAGTDEVVASAAQHGLDRCKDKALWRGLGVAYASAEPKVSITTICFDDDDDGSS